jgi:hypothetical protein
MRVCLSAPLGLQIRLPLSLRILTGNMGSRPVWNASTSPSVNTKTGFNFAYERDKTALEHYEAPRYVALAVRHWLEMRFPERFTEVRKQFHATIEALEGRLRALGEALPPSE